MPLVGRDCDCEPCRCLAMAVSGWHRDCLSGRAHRNVTRRRRQEWEIYAPTRVDQTLHCSARVAERYRRRDRDVVAQEMW